TSLAFVANPGTDPNAPRFYVTELYGRLKVVTNDGRVLPFADRLLNLNPTGVFPGSGEMGVVGVCLPPQGHDVYATMVFRDQANSLRNKLVRFRSDDGLSADAAEDLLVVKPGQGLARAAHQMQQCSFGPDGKLYVSVGDGAEAANSQSDKSFGGKILRLNPDGSAPTDNPFYDPAQPAAPISFILAKGLRNAYGLDWRPSDGRLYLTDNGPSVDRIIRLTSGFNYGWDGSDASMHTHAAFTWPEGRWSPVGLAFVEGPNAAALPADRHGQLLVASSGLVYYRGTMHAGKAIQAFTLDPDGSFSRPPVRFASYVGEGHGTIVDLKLQPDGLYFTNLYHDGGDGGATAPGGQVWRIHYAGQVAVTATTRRGPAPLAVAFTATSTPAGARDCAWDFGDGQTSTAASPSHTFQQPGVYAVSRRCADSAGGQPAEALTLVTVTAGDGTVTQPAAQPYPLSVAPAAAEVVFPATGMRLSGRFKQFWDANGGVSAFGYPITPPVRESSVSGQMRLVQHFERARFEADPAATNAGEVQLGSLGRETTARRANEASFRGLIGGALDGTPERRVFVETRHSLSGAFLAYWSSTGGERLYGLPISEPLGETSLTDGKPYLVQYFERARMEHHPEAAGAPHEIQLARLGAASLVSRPAPSPP
ncbi:MAG: PQQ-dependent sugar dehydrogenase, partial [Chloroflexi bacterium]|nr:PQQ-dependent sugar dehydrogenase [Chloroflexota bacterium]